MNEIISEAKREAIKRVLNVMDVLNLITIAFDFKNVKELRQETLKRLINNRDERVREVLRCK